MNFTRPAPKSAVFAAACFFAAALGPATFPAHGAEAKPPALGLPIRCRPGKDCWLVNFVDVDPGPGRRDYACRKRTYNGHKGTDIAIRDLAVMAEGVDVVASAPGIVKALRDGMKDVDFTIAGSGSVKGRECGNGLVLVHEGGWETQYCHMRRGSLAVKKGDSVERGRKLGLVGNSGRAQFPHVHLEVRKDKRVIDPFAGVGRQRECGLGVAPLWRQDALKGLTGGTTALYNAGFGPGRLSPGDARRGDSSASRMPRTAPAMVLWVDMFWPRAGDILSLRITAPNGQTVVKRQATIKKTQARRFVLVGKKRKSRLLPPGTYRGDITLVRDKGGAKEKIISIVREVEVR
ncbi:MAG: M23 family metallopeptidase [Proteobacteria bacterium]|nr:M23 family metallopeptidase [Pseudomonadota bacterium]